MTSHDLGPKAVMGGHGERLITPQHVEFGDTSGTLYAISDAPVDPEGLMRSLAEDAADRGVTRGESSVIDMYGDEPWLTVPERDGKGVRQLPFVPLENYLEGDLTRASGLEVVVVDPYTRHPALREFGDKLIAEQLAAGRRLTNGSMMSVAHFDAAQNRMYVRPVGYFDIFAMQNYGPDVPFDEDMQFDGMSGRTLRDMLGDRNLPTIGEDSIVPNSFGIGGLLETGDGKLLLCRRRGKLGIASASGTFGYAAAGNMDWNQDLRTAFDTTAASEVLTQRGVGNEATEELGMRTSYRDPRRLFGHALQRLALSELGIQADECSAVPAGIARDGLHMGMPQATYLLRTELTAGEVVERMVTAPDAKKEYDMVLAVDRTPAAIGAVMRNEFADFGVEVNAETRSSLASVVAQQHGSRLLFGE